MVNYWSASPAERAAALEDNEIDALQCVAGGNYAEIAAIVAERHDVDMGLAWAIDRARKLGAVQLTPAAFEVAPRDADER